jgi:hypothetical protein
LRSSISKGYGFSRRLYQQTPDGATETCSAFFNSVHLSPSSPTPTATSTPRLPSRTRKEAIGPRDMVNFSKLDNKALIEAAVAPSASLPELQREHHSSYGPKDLDNSVTISGKKRQKSNKASLSSDNLVEPNSSEESVVTKPFKKKRKRLGDDEPRDSLQGRLQTKSNVRVYIPEHIGNCEEQDDASLGAMMPTKTTLTVPPRKPPSSCKTATAPTRRKSLGTPVPNSLENAHPADKELFRMKADGKPWKEIKLVWERLMDKQIGDSTLSVRYGKMKENFEKTDGKDVS